MPSNDSPTIRPLRPEDRAAYAEFCRHLARKFGARVEAAPALALAEVRRDLTAAALPPPPPGGL